jgi:hypothetical protein
MRSRSTSSRTQSLTRLPDRRRLRGHAAHRWRIDEMVGRSLMLVTALSPGDRLRQGLRDRAQVDDEGLPFEAALKSGYMTRRGSPRSSTPRTWSATVSPEAEGPTAWVSASSVDRSLGIKLLHAVLSVAAGSVDVISFLGLAWRAVHRPLHRQPRHILAATFFAGGGAQVAHLNRQGRRGGRAFAQNYENFARIRKTGLKGLYFSTSADEVVGPMVWLHEASALH